MMSMKKLDRHAGLVKRMAEATGADLSEALSTRELAGQEMRTAVLRCCGCRSEGACGDWLEAHPEGAPKAPGFCRNADFFASLRP